MMEGPSKSGFREIGRRELGFLPPLLFARRVGGSEALVKRLSLYGKLHGHKGCVNTVHFNPSGDLLVTGSDDRKIIIWDWAAKTKKFAYPSGHLENVFQARIMPFTDDRTIVTSAADGQVIVGQIMENGQVSTKHLGTHRGRVHKLAIEPGSPHIFYSCGEDGLVQHYDLRSSSATKLFYCSSFSENKQPIPLNAIVIDPRNPNYFSLGGFDEYARIYDIRNYHIDALSSSDRPVDIFCPRHLIGSDNAHITGLAYSNTSELLVSYNDELIYLFRKGMGLGPNPRSSPVEESEKLDKPEVYSGHRNSKTVKGVNFFGPNDEYVASGSDCGRVYIWRKKGGELMAMMVGDKHIVNCVEPHPYFPFLATSGFDKNVKIWTPTASESVPLPENAKEVMAANKRGREARAQVALSPDVIMHVLRLHRRQASAYVEPQPSTTDLESDNDDEREALLIGYTGADADSEENSDGDPRDCIVS
uniref:DDB1- and CUL4-associated factor 8 n=1 Tax=Ananas comosus var. bracteatus TaxID=296719 RepID=A0A6V7PUQ1_ANACO|nr:unnamed protein product [Ananas comosus var. bracteatus]